MFARARADVATMGRLLPAAERAARAEGFDEPAAQHLVLAALAEPDGTAAVAVASLGIGESDLRAAFAPMPPPPSHAARQPPPGGAARGPYRADASARDLFQRARRLARADRSPMRSGYVLLAAAELASGAVPDAFRRLGVEAGQVRAAARAALDAGTP